MMENTYKGLTVPKWVLIVWPKIPQMSQNLFAQFVCPSLKYICRNRYEVRTNQQGPQKFLTFSLVLQTLMFGLVCS